jgi:hypothetical protein
LPVLDKYDPESDLITRRIAGKTVGKSFVYLIRDEYGNEDYYPLPAKPACIISSGKNIRPGGKSERS